MDFSRSVARASCRSTKRLEHFRPCCSHPPMAGRTRRFFHTIETAHRAVATAAAGCLQLRPEVGGFHFGNCFPSPQSSPLRAGRVGTKTRCLYIRRFVPRRVIVPISFRFLSLGRKVFRVCGPRQFVASPLQAELRDNRTRRLLECSWRCRFAPQS
jgi:hypothetical protein